MASTLPTFEEKSPFLKEKPQKGMCIQITQNTLFEDGLLESCPLPSLNGTSFRVELMSSITCWAPNPRSRDGMTDGNHSNNPQWYLKSTLECCQGGMGTKSAPKEMRFCRVPSHKQRGSGFFLLEYEQQELFGKPQNSGPEEVSLKRANILLVNKNEQNEINKQKSDSPSDGQSVKPTGVR